MSTRDVTNQPPARVDVDEFAADIPLVEAVDRYDAGWAVAELGAVGRLVGSAAFQDDAERANRNEPELRAFDRWGTLPAQERRGESWPLVLSDRPAQRMDSCFSSLP